MKLGVLINQHATKRGDGTIASRVREGFADAGVNAVVREVKSASLTEGAREFLKSGCDALAVGGGDGTLSTVADISVVEKVPMGVLPLGTHNHFARDAGLPLKLEESIKCIAQGSTRRVDMGEVNGRHFINNSSIGAYPRAVEEREGFQHRFGLKKGVAGMIAILKVFSGRPEVNAIIEIDGKQMNARGPFVFVGNNEYSMRLFAPKMRASLTAGTLCIYTARCNGVSGLFRLLWLTMSGRIEQARDFEMALGKEVTIQLRRKEVRVSRDGEVAPMATPLHYRIDPLSLTIFSPAS